MPNFSHSCNNINYDPNSTILEAECREAGENGEMIPTNIRLNDHIGNINGVLTFGFENYQATCRNCHLESMNNDVNIFLICECETTTPNHFIPTQLLLDQQISNIDSQLEYDGEGGHDEL